MSSAPPTQKGPRQYQKHGDSHRQRRLCARGIAGIDRRSAEGREALAWYDAALTSKGAACPFAIKVEIRLAVFDLWRLLYLQSFMITDANRRGTIINRRKRELSRVHEQYSTIEQRFARRVESLGLDKGGPPDGPGAPSGGTSARTGGQMIKLCIAENNTSSAVRCALCGEWHDPQIGPSIVIHDGGVNFVCDDCGKRESPVLCLMMFAYRHYLSGGGLFSTDVDALLKEHDGDIAELAARLMRKVGHAQPIEAIEQGVKRAAAIFPLYLFSPPKVLSAGRGRIDHE